MHNIKLTTEKNSPTLLAISMAMRSGGTVPSASPSTAGLGLPEMPLDAAIRRVFAPYRPGGCHGHQFWSKKSSCGIVKHRLVCTLLAAASDDGRRFRHHCRQRTSPNLIIHEVDIAKLISTFI